MTARSIPPPVLGSLRVLGYAPYSDALPPETLVVLAGGVGDRDASARVAALGPVPNLALAESLDDPASMELLYCDGDWNVRVHHVVEDAAAARALVEHDDASNAPQWQPLPGTREDALAYYDRSNEKSRCSFCSKRAFQVAMLIEGRLIEGASGIVCNECVARFRRATQAN